MRQARFSFDAEMIRSADAASNDNARLIWLMLTFIRVREVGFDRYRSIFSRSERTFKRDIKQLRELGARYGFELMPQREKIVRLKHFEAKPPSHVAGEAASETVRALSDAFGDIVAASIRDVVRIEGTTLDRFLRIATPRLAQPSAVASTYHTVREAWRANARVRFRYPARSTGKLVERVVEPHATTYNAGRYYLVGFDVRPRTGGWRQFALDRMCGPIQRAGSFARRVIPDAYRGEDAVGLFKTGSSFEVVVELSASIAEAVLARAWQRNERIERRPDRSATITFAVFDIGEAVRWAFAFGSEARVVAPAAAVDIARTMTAQMAQLYDSAGASLRGVS